MKIIDDESISVACIRLLAAKSATPQHEMIADMLNFFGVNGTRELHPHQIAEYTAAVSRGW